MRIMLLIVWMLAVQSRAVFAEDDIKDTDTMVRETVGSVLSLLRNENMAEDVKGDKILEIIRPVFDFNLMAMLTLGKKYWSKFDKKEGEEFTSLLVTRLENSYIEKIGLFSDETVEYGAPVRIKKNKIHVETWVVSKDGRISIKYKLYKKDGEWKVYDVEIKDVSIVSAYRSQYRDILRKGSVGDLLEKMREKAKEAGDSE